MANTFFANLFQVMFLVLVAIFEGTSCGRALNLTADYYVCRKLLHRFMETVLLVL